MPAKIEAWEFNSPAVLIAADGFRLLAHVGRLQFDGREIAEEWPGDLARVQVVLKQGSPEVGPPIQDQAALRRQVEEDKFRDWVAARIKEGRDQKWIVGNASAAFPHNIVPGREDRRAIDRQVYRDLKGVDRKPGKDVG